MQFFNYFIMENNGTKIHGKHEIQYGMHLRYDQLTYMPQQQRTAGSITFRAIDHRPLRSDKQHRQHPQAMSNTGHVAGCRLPGLCQL